MKGSTAIAFLGLVATLSLFGCLLANAQAISGMIDGMENTIRSETRGLENTLRRNLPSRPNIRMPNINMPDIGLPDIGLPQSRIIARMRSELQALESDISNAMPNMPSASGILNRVRGMIRSLMPINL